MRFHSPVCVLSMTLLGAMLSAPTPAETFRTLRGALDEVAAKYQIQVGLEYATKDKDLQPITLDLTARKVEAVLTQLTSQKADYKWSFTNGVYDVYPNSNPDSILDVKIREFKIKDLSSKDAANLVGQIPEIREWLVTRSVSRREFQVGPSTPSSRNWLLSRSTMFRFARYLTPLFNSWESWIGWWFAMVRTRSM